MKKYILTLFIILVIGLDTNIIIACYLNKIPLLVAPIIAILFIQVLIGIGIYNIKENI